MIYFVRHAKDDESYVGSWSEVSILPSEEEKVRSLAKELRNYPITNIVSSDILRARQTAILIAEELSLPIRYEKALREQNKGTLTGRKKTTLTEEERDLIDHQQVDTMFPDGETLRNVYERMKDYLEEIKKMQEGTLIVTHRGVINMIYYILTNTPLDMDKKRFDVDHLSVHEYDRGKQKIRRIL